MVEVVEVVEVAEVAEVVEVVEVVEADEEEVLQELIFKKTIIINIIRASMNTPMLQMCHGTRMTRMMTMLVILNRILHSITTTIAMVEEPDATTKTRMMVSFTVNQEDESHMKTMLVITTHLVSTVANIQIIHSTICTIDVVHINPITMKAVGTAAAYVVAIELMSNYYMKI